jgi:hypothetical protein
VSCGDVGRAVLSARLGTGWRPEKGTGKHRRQSRAPGVVQALNRERAALEAHRVDVAEPSAGERAGAGCVITRFGTRGAYVQLMSLIG